MRALAVLTLVGCTYGKLDKLPPPHQTETHPLEVQLDRDIDLLFLVDDSPSMSDKQANLGGNFGNFIDVLSADGDLPSLHVGVATSDLGTLGTNGSVGPGIGTLGQGGCASRGKDGALQLYGAPVTTRPYLIDFELPDRTRQKNYTGTIQDAFKIMAKAGAGGCGFEQTLEAMKRALDPANTVNAGFVRPEAALAVVFITDEDDCSMVDTTMLGPESAALGPQQSFRCTRFGITCDDGGATPDAMNEIGAKARCHPSEASPYLTDVAGYVSFLKQLKPDPSKLVVAGIMGTRTPVATVLRPLPPMGLQIPALDHSCMYIGGDGGTEVADPPVRLGALLDAFPGREAFASICQRDLSAGLRQIASLLKQATGDACLARPLIDFDLNEAGDQHFCEVTAGDAGLLPACEPDDDTAANAPCWRVIEDAACTAGAHQRVVIEGAGLLPSGTKLAVACAVAP